MEPKIKPTSLSLGVPDSRTENNTEHKLATKGKKIFHKGPCSAAASEDRYFYATSSGLFAHEEASPYLFLLRLKLPGRF